MRCNGTGNRHDWEDWRYRQDPKPGEVQRARTCRACGQPEVAYLYESREMTGAAEVEG